MELRTSNYGEPTNNAVMFQKIKFLTKLAQRIFSADTNDFQVKRGGAWCPACQLGCCKDFMEAAAAVLPGDLLLPFP